MFKPALQLSALLAGLVCAACGGGDDSVARVTIDVRCGEHASCPEGFACTADTEHGPPTTMCQSDDAEATCPAGYETQIGHGQTFCKPRTSDGARGDGAAPLAVHGRRASHSADHHGGDRR